MTTQETRSDAGLASALRISVTRLARRLRAERAAHGLPVLSELSDTQMGALGTLVAHGAMTPSELADHEKVQPPSMTRVIAVLEQHGLVARAAHATDKRQVVLTVTDTGWLVNSSAAQVVTPIKMHAIKATGIREMRGERR